MDANRIQGYWYEDTIIFPKGKSCVRKTYFVVQIKSWTVKILRCVFKEIKMVLRFVLWNLDHKFDK